jgi:hypothetical protein
MKPIADFSPLCQAFFAKRLVTQRNASPHTIAAYAQTFRLFLAYAQERPNSTQALSRTSWTAWKPAGAMPHAVAMPGWHLCGRFITSPLWTHRNTPV